ncbi:MAG: putative membrane protein [Candidatus Azotimanducaceae bacterium]|jgi:uncharacterized membrane protein
MSNRSTLIALVISVTLNLLVVGAVMGHFLRGGPEPRFPAHLGGILENIAPEQRIQMRKQFREFKSEGRELHQAMRQKQRQLVRVILKEPFDEEAARTGFKELREQGDSVQSHMHDQMLLAMKNLNKEDRKQLIRKLLRGRTRPEQQEQQKPPPD